MPAAAVRAVGKAMSKVLALMEIMFYWEIKSKQIHSFR